MDSEELQEVIFEAWVYKYQGHEGRHTLRLSGRWKRRYIILLRYGNHACVQYYEKKPETLEDTPKGCVVLDTWFMVKKRLEYQGRHHVCEVITANSKLLLLSTEEEKIFHLLTFFLQTQIKLREESEAACFIVRPDGSDDHMKLGSRGSMCLLHVSKGGITLALQLSRCVLAQWPLSCIKLYDGEVRGQFMIETGKNAPTGAGKYVFNTRLDQNKTIYDILDMYVMELAGLKQMAMQRTSAQSDTLENVIAQQYDVLQELVQPESDPRFISHLKKVSRGIYDQLAEHLGATSHSRLDISNSEPTSSSGPPMMKFVPKRSASQHSASSQNKLVSDNFSSMSLGHQRRGSRPKPPDHLPLKREPLPAPRTTHAEIQQTDQTPSTESQHDHPESMSRDMHPMQYLHMSPVEGADSSRSPDRDLYVTASNQSILYENNRMNDINNSGKSKCIDSQSSHDVQYTEMSANDNNLTGVDTQPACDPRRLTFDGYSIASDIHSNLRISNGSWTSSPPELASGQSSLKVTSEQMKPGGQSVGVHPGSVYQDMSGSPPKIKMTDNSSALYQNKGGTIMKFIDRRLSQSYEDVTSNQTESLSPNQSSMTNTNNSKASSLLYNNQQPLLRRQYSRSCEDLSTDDATVSKQYPAYANSESSNARQMSDPQGVIHDHQKSVLQRCHSRSCENVTEYSQITNDKMYENEGFSGSEKPPDQEYSYVAPEDVSIVNNVDYSQMLRDKSALYAKVVPKGFRRSRSMSNMTSPTNTSTPHTASAGKKHSKRPTKFDFNKLRLSSSKDSPTSSSPASGSGTYMQVGKSKFWNVSMDESPSKIVTSTAIRGINVTKETRVFSRRVSNESQQPASMRCASESPQKADGSTMEFHHTDLSSSSMKGRRLPSLPPDASVVIAGLNTKDALC